MCSLNSSGCVSHPILHPVILKLFEAELITIKRSEGRETSRKLGATVPVKII